MKGALVLLVLASTLVLVQSQVSTHEFTVQGAAEQAVRQADAQIQTQQANQQAQLAQAQAQSNTQEDSRAGAESAAAQVPRDANEGGDNSPENQPEPLNCQELGVKFTKIFDKIAEEKHVPVNVLLAARGLGVTMSKGQTALKVEIDKLADTQRHTNHCLDQEYDRMRSAQQLVETLANQMHVSVEAFLKKCETKISRERFYRDVKEANSLPDAATEKLKVFLQVNGDPPWLTFKKMMMEHKEETKQRLRKLEESATMHATKVNDITSEEQKTRREVLDLINSIAAATSKVGSSAKETKELDKMEDKLSKLIAMAEGSVGQWGDRVSRLHQNEKYQYARAGATLLVNTHRLLQSEDKDFNKMTNWTARQIRHLLHSNEMLKREVQRPLDEAKRDIALFKRSRDSLAEAMKKDQDRVAEDFSRKAQEVKKDIEYLVVGNMRGLEAEVESRVNKALANTRHQMLMMAQKERGAQEIELGRMRTEIDELTQEAWDLRREAEVAVREQKNHEREFRRFRQDMEKDWERDNTQLKHRENQLSETMKGNDQRMSGESETLQQTIKLESDSAVKDMDHLTQEIEENLKREAGNRRKETEFQIDEINSEILKDKSELQEIMSDRDQAVQVAAGMVSKYQAKSNALKSRLLSLEQDIDADLKKIPSPQEKRLADQEAYDKAEDECKKIAKNVSDQVAPGLAKETAMGALTVNSIKEMKQAVCKGRKQSEMLELNENAPARSF